MKKLIYIVFFIAVFNNAFGTNYPFQVQQSGKGPETILFIPGFTSPASVWDNTKKLFEPNYTCYTVTMAGFAGTPAQENPSFKNWEEGLAQFIKDKKIKPIVIGHSMGGGLALALAADYPDLISKIVIVDALPYLAAAQNPNAKSMPDSIKTQIITQLKAMPAEQFQQMQTASVKGLVADTSKYKDLVDWSVSTDRNTFATMFVDFMNTDLRPVLAKIKCPALILLEPSFKQIQSTIEPQYDSLKNKTIAYANKGLHFIMYDDFDWYKNQLTNFITVK